MPVTTYIMVNVKQAFFSISNIEGITAFVNLWALGYRPTCRRTELLVILNDLPFTSRNPDPSPQK